MTESLKVTGFLVRDCSAECECDKCDECDEASSKPKAVQVGHGVRLIRAVAAPADGIAATR